MPSATTTELPLACASARTTAVGTIDELLRARVDDDRTALRHEGNTWTWSEVLEEASARAALLRSLPGDGQPHVGALLDNTPEFVFWLAATALSGWTLVGLNSTRRGAELEQDIAHTECRLLVTDDANRTLLTGLHVPQLFTPSDLDPFRGAPLAPPIALPTTQYLLVFTSGTSGAPKAVIVSQGRLHAVGGAMLYITDLTADDVTYCAMPLFHSNALFTAWGPTLAAGATLALRSRFSASQFLPDVRAFGATYFNYVGKPLAYVLATPSQADDHDNTLRIGFGNEANERDITAFTERFGCRIVDGYGSSESGVSISRTPDTPPGSIGRGADTVMVVDPDTTLEKARAIFDPRGQLLNAEEATGEIVNTAGLAGFEGYWNNPSATAERARHGWYWSGDLGYRDDAGFVYFAGRSAEWVRVDGENFAVAPVERIMARFPGVVLCAAYGVPDPIAGDRLMLAIQLANNVEFDPDSFSEFLSAQSDLGPKWVPSYVRVVSTLPITATNKVLKRELQREGIGVDDPVWVRGDRSDTYVRRD
jgi:fatty-acyl-CoA synthase